MFDPPKKPPVKPGKKVVESASKENLSVAEAEDEVARLREKVKETQIARISLSWVIEE